ncbi:copper-binding protein [Rhodoplanes elegans]|uniref:Copper-binding protein n=1 Tax=Rhodoplanes elegans TaxID=29408 RepID=A0A327KJB2_9BRAD|nr:SCO family protein [Rhodoplanes elegans]MBK5960963.1 copper-binding protein [Rhodoplanes elegans]RAI35378.1 copper-binding protein [Rhodoplanes elegans]
MASRASRLALLAGAFSIGLLLCLGLVLVATGRLGGGSQVATAAAVGGPFRLVDQDGKPISDTDFRGKPFLMFFGFTHCPDVCPTALFEASELLRALGPDASRTAVLFVSVDPERDTPAVLKDYLSSFEPGLRGVTGTPEEIAAVAKAFRVYYRKVPLEAGDYTMDHTAIVYLMDKQGKFVAPFNIKRAPEDAAADLKKHF